MKRKDKDVEGLWAEVKRLLLEMAYLQQQLDEHTACVIVHRGSALACSDAMRIAYYDERRRAERLREDAARYRWLRRGGNDVIGVVRGFDVIEYGSSSVASTYEDSLCGDRLDSAIDAAMQRISGGDHG